METNTLSYHLAGIVPVAGEELGFNMPWHDSLMPIHENYHAVERAVHTAAMAGCHTIWVVLHRDAQPLIKKKLTSWIYDPQHVWQEPYVFFNKREIPIYYVAINPRDKLRKDSQAWSAIYGAKVASYISSKISRWVVPKRFLVVSPYGVVSEDSIKNSRVDLRGVQNIAFTHNGKTFLDNVHLPFTFDANIYQECKKHFAQSYTGADRDKTFKDIFSPVSLDIYRKIDLNWHFDISSWEGYRGFLSSKESASCERPKYLVKHKWRGLVKDH
jgi:hypothetical protein